MNLARWNLPPLTAESLEAYALHGRPTGGFLRSVLEGDLFGAAGRADTENAEALHTIAKAIRSDLPKGSWGSRGIVDAWIARGGLEGRS